MRYRVNEPSVIHQAIDGELVIIHLDRGLYYSLDSTGARIWAALAAGRPAGSVIDEICRDLVAQLADVAPAVDGLIDQLRSEELLVPDGGPDAPGDGGEPATAEADDTTPAAAAGTGPVAFTAPVLQRYDDLQDLLLLDPIHAVDESGWPDRPDGG